jgi:hypothetical protein
LNADDSGLRIGGGFQGITNTTSARYAVFAAAPSAPVTP